MKRGRERPVEGKLSVRGFLFSPTNSTNHSLPDSIVDKKSCEEQMDKRTNRKMDIKANGNRTREQTDNGTNGCCVFRPAFRCCAHLKAG